MISTYFSSHFDLVVLLQYYMFSHSLVSFFHVSINKREENLQATFISAR